MRKERGFTLIELLIVVAIIAILAAIAVPNLIEAQVRAKISRARTDMRTLGIAIESYIVDNNEPLPDYSDWERAMRVPVGLRQGCYRFLTTPIAYLSSMPEDPFAKFTKDGDNPRTNRDDTKYYNYQHYFQSQSNDAWIVQVNAMRKFCWDRGFTWSLYSVGPIPYEYAPYMLDLLGGPNSPRKVPTSVSMGMVYDPTNGSVSRGRILLTNKGVFSGNDMPRY